MMIGVLVMTMASNSLSQGDESLADQPARGQKVLRLSSTSQTTGFKEGNPHGLAPANR